MPRGGVNRITLKNLQNLSSGSGIGRPGTTDRMTRGSGSPLHLCRINQCAGVNHNNLRGM
jgi:hypothetical protein